MPKRYWLSYDIRTPETYEPLYRWLAEINAKECGNSVATFIFDGDTNALKENLKQNIPAITSEKIYVIYSRKDKFGTVGIFLWGNRNKTNPWDIYAIEKEQILDD